MNYQFTIKDFRIFGKEGATFNVNPITLLTGCNSSGKSSFVKALTLISDFLGQAKVDYNKNGDIFLQNYKLDFTKKLHQNLGNFSKVINKKANNKDAIKFSYQYQSLLLAENVIVELSFVCKDKDELNNGWLSEIDIKKENGEIIYSAKVNKENILEIEDLDLVTIKQNFIDFAVICCGFSTIDAFEELQFKPLDSGISKDECRKNIQEIKDVIAEMGITDEVKNSYKLWQENLHYDNSNIQNKFVFAEDWEIIKNAYSQNTLFPMPIFEWLKGVSKAETRGVIQDKIKEAKELDYGVQFNLNRILDDFENSEYNTLLEYFIQKEKDIVSEAKTHINLRRTKGIFIKEALLYTKVEYERMRNLYPTGNYEGDEHFCSADEARLYFEQMEMSFIFIFSSLMDLCISLNEDFRQLVSDYRHRLFDLIYIKHPVYGKFQKFFESLLKEAISPQFLNDIKFVGSTRANVQRLYTADSQGTDFNGLLLRYFDAKKNHKGSEYIPDSFMNEWVKKFEIGNYVELKTTEEGLGILLYLHKDDGSKHLLAEEGYGITQIFSLLLQIETAVLETKYTHRPIDTTKYIGAARVVGETKAYPEPTTIAVEEPEIHLHPKLQSLLADMFLEAYQKFNIRFIVETHSEYLIRKTQVLVAQQNYSTNEETDNKSPFRTYYLSKDEMPYSLVYRKDGKFAEKFGSGFYDEATNLTFEIL